MPPQYATETHRAMAQVNRARMARQKRTEITLDPMRRRAVEWNLQRGGFIVEESTLDPNMTVIKW
jgi:hypothetical protein